jgi:hypothetical protein
MSKPILLLIRKQTAHCFSVSPAFANALCLLHNSHLWINVVKQIC